MITGPTTEDYRLLLFIVCFLHGGGKRRKMDAPTGNGKTHCPEGDHEKRKTHQRKATNMQLPQNLTAGEKPTF